MKKLNFILLPGLVFLLIAGCSKVDIQPDAMYNSEDTSLSSDNIEFKKGKKHLVPWSAKFDVTTKFLQMGPPITYTETYAKGTATHLGKTDAFLDQWWTRHPSYNLPPGFSHGEGTIVFTAANGDELWATYHGMANHNLDPYPTIETEGTFTGGTGRFANASGIFEWHGEFNQIIKAGTVIAEGFIMY